MAIYRCEVKSHSRRAGKNKVSAVAAIAYRTGLRLIDNRGEIHNYTKRKGVEHSQIIRPRGAPEWAYDRQLLWSAADKAEKRADAKFGREFIVALPHELDAAARTELAVKFTRLLVDRFGFVADVAVHKPKTGDNHHAHILCSTRVLTAEGFTGKTRDLDDKRYSTKLISQIRADWEDMTNAALANAGLDIRVDRRSHAELGDGLLPEVSLTRHDAELERQGTPTINGDYNRKIAKQNADVIEQRAEELRQAQLKAEEDRLAKEAQEAAKIIATAREAQEARERRAEQAKIAKIDGLTQKQGGLENRYLDAWFALEDKEKEYKNALAKIDKDESDFHAGLLNTPYNRYFGTERADLKECFEPVRVAAKADVHKTARAWAVDRAELEHLGHSFELPPRSLWAKLSGKKSDAEQSEENYSHAQNRASDPDFVRAVDQHAWNEKQAQYAAANAAQYKADEPLRKARHEAEMAAAELRNAEVRATRGARDNAPTKPKTRTDQDNDNDTFRP
jgi:hypothetical protein